MTLTTMLDALRDPQMRHAALVHLPIALSVLGVLGAVVSACLVRRKDGTLRWVAVALSLLLLLTAILAVRSGEDAEDALRVQTSEAYAAIEAHEEMAEKVWIFALGTTVLLVGGTLRARRVAATAAWIAVLASLATAGWVGATAHRGGDLVYRLGVGMPRTTTSAALDDANLGEDPRVAFFAGTVRPILEDRCMGCHNPGKKGPAGGLDQTSIRGMLAGGDSGRPAIVPGRPDESRLVQTAAGEIEDLMMPPGDGEPLDAAALDALRRWIRDGAVWTGSSESP